MSFDLKKVPVFLRSDPDTVVRHLSFDSREELVGFLRGPWWAHGELDLDEPAGLDLTGIDLSGMDLSHRSFWCSKMIGANLSGSDLSNAKFSETDLTNATLDDCTGQRVSFSQTTMHYPNKGINGLHMGGCKLKGASLQRVHFERGQISGSDFTGADLRNAVMQLCVIRETSFEVANFEGADFSNSDITDSVFLGTNITDAQLSAARHAGLRTGRRSTAEKLARRPGRNFPRKKPSSPRFS